MKRQEMMNIPARTLNMCEKLHDLCDVEIRQVRPGESESREVVDGHVEAAMLSPRFEYFVAESLCGLSHDQAIIEGIQINEVLKSDRYKRLWRRLYMANYLALPVSDDLTKALGLYADKQNFQHKFLPVFCTIVPRFPPQCNRRIKKPGSCTRCTNWAS